MNPNPSLKMSLLVLLSLTALSGCATSPAARAVAHSCADLGAARMAAEQSRREAQQQQHDAWHAVVPFLVAGRYASARSKAAAAERRVAEIDGELARGGCLSAAL